MIEWSKEFQDAADRIAEEADTMIVEDTPWAILLMRNGVPLLVTSYQQKGWEELHNMFQPGDQLHPVERKHL